MFGAHDKPTPSHPSRLVPAVGDPVSSFWYRLRKGTRILRKQPDWERFVGEDWAERIMTEEVTDQFHAKQGRSIARWQLRSGRERLSVYLKRHYRLPWGHGLLATLFPDRAWSPGLQEFQHLCWARARGFPVPRPVAAGQLIGPWFRLQSFLAVEELHGMLPLHQAIPLAAKRLNANEFSRWKRGLTAELARLTRELHRRHVYHKDLYFCHFYIPESFTQMIPETWTNRAVMIDLHRLARHRLTGIWWQIKDLAQLLYSSEVDGVAARDRLRFWKLYRQHWPGSWSGNRLRPLIRWKWTLYQRQHNRRQSIIPRTSAE